MTAALAIVTASCAAPPSVPPRTAAPTTAASASSAPTTSSIRVDRALLDHLPPELSGLTVEFSAEASEEAADSAALAGAEALAYAVAVDQERGELAIATVLKPLAPGFDDVALRRLRDSYDAAVCGSEGGLRGNAEAEISGRVVHIGTCAGGGHTYATRLSESGVIVLAFSRGEQRLGEQLMARLRDP